MNKKLQRDALASELQEVESILESLPKSDPASRIAFKARRDELTKAIEDLDGEYDTLASVALFFGGRPVQGSRSIDAHFAARILEHYQDAISKRLASGETGGLRERGPVPSRDASRLNITNVVHGSFGFLLEEREPDSKPFLNTSLRERIQEITNTLDRFTGEDEKAYSDAIDQVDSRLFSTLRQLLHTLRTEEATFRVVEGDRERNYNSQAIDRAYRRVEATDVEDADYTVTGSLVGVTPISRRFEFRISESGEVISGRFGPKLSQDFMERIENDTVRLGQRWYALVHRRTTTKPSGRTTVQYTLKDLSERAENLSKPEE